MIGDDTEKDMALGWLQWGEMKMMRVSWLWDAAGCVSVWMFGL